MRIKSFFKYVYFRLAFIDIIIEMEGFMRGLSPFLNLFALCEALVLSPFCCNQTWSKLCQTSKFSLILSNCSIPLLQLNEFSLSLFLLANTLREILVVEGIFNHLPGEGSSILLMLALNHQRLIISITLEHIGCKVTFSCSVQLITEMVF